MPQKKRIHEPSLGTMKNRAKEILLHSIIPPKGYRDLSQKKCWKLLGAPFYYYNPRSRHYMFNTSALWAYDSKDSLLYFKNKADLGIVSITILSKQSK